MPRIAYVNKNFNRATLATIERANSIIEEYAAQGFVLTLRQLYYQFVARGLLENRQQEYKRLGSTLNDARLAGLVDWNAIEDRTRFLRSNSHWDSPADILDGCARQFAVDKWADQAWRPEVWIEKDALVGVIEPICRRLDVAYFACRGYNSQSEQWVAGMRLRERRGDQRAGQRTLVLHLGDHDPSGIDMTRDNDDRLSMFAGYGWGELRRIALNRNQVNQYQPPPNPAKITDSRYEGYVREHGEESWELDALEPRVIEELIRSNIEEIRDPDLWDAAVEREEDGRTRLEGYARMEREE
jgi:hypothetical protein